MKQLNLTDAQFDTIRNMVNFASWHASDGMSPALSENFIEDIVDDVLREARYEEQKQLIMSARAVLGLDEEGPYAEIFKA